MRPIKSSCLVLALAGSSFAAFADAGQWKIDTSTTATGLGADWAVDLGGAKARCSLSLRVVDGRLVLVGASSGMFLIVR